MSERDDAREILRELLAEALAGGNGNGHRPCRRSRRRRWPRCTARRRGGAAGRAIGGGAPSTSTIGRARRADLDRFVRGLLARRRRSARRSARAALRFTLARPGPAQRAGVVRVDRGAVTERKVEEAARPGARLVLGARRRADAPRARQGARQGDHDRTGGGRC